MADEELPPMETPQEEQAPIEAAPAEPSTPQEQAMAILGVVKKNLPAIIGVVVVLAAVYFYLFVLPKPGTLTISVFELDAGDTPFADAEATVTDANGNTVATPILDTSGVTVVGGIPSGQLRVSISSNSPDFASASQTVTLPSGGAATATILIPKNADVEFKGVISGQKIGSGCAKTFTVSVANNGDNPFDAELLAEPAELSALFTYSGPQTIDAQSSASFSFTISVPAESTEVPSGDVRVRYTEAKADFSATVVEPPDMRVDPGEIDIRCPEGRCGDVQVTIRNDGKSDLTDLSIELGGGITQDDLEIIGFDSGKAVKPDARTTFFVRGKAGGIGKVGKLIVHSGCSDEELPVSISGG